MKSPRLRRSLQNNNDLKSSLLSLLSNNSIWLFSLMKSGTTYTALFLSNYFNYLYGDRKGVDFDRMNREYCNHSLESHLNLEDITKREKENKFVTQQLAGYNGFFTTHIPIKKDLWSKNISLYRNPLDYFISSYFFHYVNRGKRCSHPMKIVDHKIPEFAKTIKEQRTIQALYPDKVLQLSYEDLIRFPEDHFAEMIHFLGLELDQKGVEFAMLNSSKKKVKEMEEIRGEAIVKKDGIKFKGSFIRSGKIGEWKEYFSDHDLIKIDHKLNKHGLSLNEFQLE